MIRIAFQGLPGAYSHQAMINHFQEEVEPVSCLLSEEVIEKVEKKEASLGLLPVENSLVGNVTVNLDLLYYSDLEVIEEIYFPIQHCFLARKGVSVDQIKVVRSHPIALAQCREFIKDLDLQQIAEHDTAGAASVLSKDQSRQNEAVICGRLNADLYDLQVLSESIQDEAINMTRFFLFSRREQSFSSLRQQKTSIAFKTDHKPGALLNALNIFSKHGLNLTKLESRPDPKSPFQYIFFVDFEGAAFSGDGLKCLKELEGECAALKILGSYQKGNFSLS